MTKLYRYPKKTEFGKIISKQELYKRATVPGKLKKLFTSQVKRIVWAHKIAASTINLSASDNIEEFQILRIDSYQTDFDHSILAFIDAQIPSPIIFEIHCDNKVKISAIHYRHKNQAHSSNYYQSPWLNNAQRQQLPLFLNIADLYAHLIEQLLASTVAATPQQIKGEQIQGQQQIEEQAAAYSANAQPQSMAPAQTIAQKTAIADKIIALRQQIVKKERQLQQQKQYNRQVEINQQLQQLQLQLQQQQQQLAAVK